LGYARDCNVAACYATGSVTGVESVGGLVGYAESASKGVTMEDSYARGMVTGSAYVAGLVGYVTSGTVVTCYTTGLVTGSYFRGALVGYRWYTPVIFSFWDIETSGITWSNSGEGKTTAQMQEIATYLEARYWDFSNIWSICEGTNYPRLLWSIPPADMLCPDGVDFIDYSYLADRWLWTDYGDVNGMEVSGDGKISNPDYAMLSSMWGRTACGNCGGFDYSGDGSVGWPDVAVLFEHWLATDYGDCEGADLTTDGRIDHHDLKAFSTQYLSQF
jgi:hypothetical protein